MSRRSPSLRRLSLVVVACSLVTALASCAGDGPAAPRPRPVFDGGTGDSTPPTPCDSSATSCHPTQPWA